jgi:hypothetical protein
MHHALGEDLRAGAWFESIPGLFVVVACIRSARVERERVATTTRRVVTIMLGLTVDMLCGPRICLHVGW